jgi:peptide chain release factor
MTLWVQISAGEGPAECCWVVARLEEVLIEQAAAVGLEARVLERVDGEQPGTFKTVLLSLDGDDPAAFMADWEGTVQWIGKSPYRPHHKRKNWFVGVETFEPPATPRWSDDELRVDVMRSSGPGGQHVNKTESAVRVTHLPTGLSAIAREERSQHLNRRLALARLARLFEQQGQASEADLRRQRWQKHHALVRGQAVRVFEGPDFRPRK